MFKLYILVLALSEAVYTGFDYLLGFIVAISLFNLIRLIVIEIRETRPEKAAKSRRTIEIGITIFLLFFSLVILGM